MKTAICLVVLVLVAIPASAEVTLTLSMAPDSGLPGIPATMHVVASNSSDAPAVVPTTVTLRVTRRDGQPSPAADDSSAPAVVATFPDTTGPLLTLAAREQRDLSFWSSPNSPPWFHDKGELFAPGIYTLQLIADASLRERYGVHLQKPLPAVVVSNTVTYTVNTPTGDDLAVYRMIEQVPDGVSWQMELANDIWSKYPESTYAHWVGPRIDASMTFEEKVTLLRAAIAKDLASVAANWQRWTLAYVYSNQCTQLTEQGKIDLAVDASDEARKLLDFVLKGTNDPELRKRAEELRSGLPTRDRIIRDYNIAAGHPLEELTPDLDCADDLMDGARRIHFGFINLTDHEWIVPVGENNKITPPPFDQGQPTRFPTGGVHDLAFSIVTSKPEITWHLDKTNLVVKVRDVPKCD